MQIERHDDGSLTIREPDTGRRWHLPCRLVRNVDAEVSERWVFNAVVPRAVCERMIDAPFLRPRLVDGRAVLSLCAIFMRRAAPSWMPLRAGTGCHNFALRIAATDVRDGSDCVWVDHRYTDSPFADVLKYFGFAIVHGGLRIERGADGGRPRMTLYAPAGRIRLTMRRGYPALATRVFADTAAFSDYFLAGVRSYGPGRAAGTLSVVDLVKERIGAMTAVLDARAELVTPMGAWSCDSVYLSRDSRYRWRYLADAAIDSRKLRVAEAGDHVVVDEPDRLHVGVADR